MKIGSYVLGILLLLSELYQAGSSKFFVEPPQDWVIDDILESYKLVGVRVKSYDLTSYFHLAYYYGMVDFFRSLISIITILILLIGVKKESYKMMLPSIVWTPIDVVYIVINISVFCSKIPDPRNLIFLAIALIVTAIVSVVLKAIYWPCVFSHYQEMKKRVQPEDSATDRIEM